VTDMRRLRVALGPVHPNAGRDGRRLGVS
jgi:hypothetical protein